MEIAGDHLVRLADLDHVIDAVHLAPVDRLEALGVADETDDRVDGAARDEGLPAVRPHPFGDGLDLAVGRVRRHHDDHLVEPPRSAWSHTREVETPGVRPGVAGCSVAAGDYAGSRPPQNQKPRYDCMCA